ncbi:MAG: RDD family protein [bacterium]
MSQPFHVRTPEGVVLDFELASVARRVMAFSLDMTIVVTVYTIVGLLLLLFSYYLDLGGWAVAAYMVFLFLFRILYFVVLEMRGRGQTPGKRVMGVRVLDSHGNPLTGSATFLRNVSRDVELFLPLTVMLVPEALISGAPWWFMVFPLIWIVLLGIFPLISPQNLRPGDVIAGTVVVLQPRLDLYDDMSEGRGLANLHLTTGQLDMYGIQEIQLLERLLRDSPTPQTIQTLAERIANKMGLEPSTWADHPSEFLHHVYRELRIRHEQRMLLGDRQETKREGRFEHRKLS